MVISSGCGDMVFGLSSAPLMSGDGTAGSTSMGVGENRALVE
jgi:hypothetical protein